MTITVKKYCQYRRHSAILLYEIKYESLQHEPNLTNLSPIGFCYCIHLELLFTTETLRKLRQSLIKNSITKFIDYNDHYFFKTGIYALKLSWEKGVEAK